MNAFDTANLRDLVGGWTLIALGAGLIGVVINWRGGSSSRTVCAPSRVAGVWATAMLLLALFIGLIVLPLSKAYSGPIPAEIRQTWRYDKYFAASTSLLFSVVFAFDAFRLRRAKHQ